MPHLGEERGREEEREGERGEREREREERRKRESWSWSWRERALGVWVSHSLSLSERLGGSLADGAERVGATVGFVGGWRGRWWLRRRALGLGEGRLYEEGCSEVVGVVCGDRFAAEPLGERARVGVVRASVRLRARQRKRERERERECACGEHGECIISFGVSKRDFALAVFVAL